jgi:predicted nucleic acid-binding protein
LAVVLDVSIVLAWCFEDERTDDVLAVATLVENEGGVVPSIFGLELANGLLMAERRKRLTASDVTAHLDAIAAFPLEIDVEDVARAREAIIGLARSTGLTTYDAAYLDLAMRRAVPLATRDAKLASAAQALGVSVLPVAPNAL